MRTAARTDNRLIQYYRRHHPVANPILVRTVISGSNNCHVALTERLGSIHTPFNVAIKSTLNPL